MSNSTHENLQLSPELLGLSDIKILDVTPKLSEREIIIRVESIRERVKCRHCSKPTAKYGHGRLLKLRHLPILGRKTIIEILPRRGRCEHCDGNPTTTQTLDWYEANSKMTKPYEQHLLFELVNSTVADVSRREEVDYHTIERLIDRYIETKTDFSDIVALGILGFDEISLKKGYRDFVTLVTYRMNEEVRILGVIKGREKADVVQFLKGIPKRLRKTVVVACCDLYEGYMNAIKEVFKGKVPIVADRFHVRRLYRKSLVALRKVELAKLKKSLSQKQYEQLKPAIALLRKHKDYFSKDEKKVLDSLFELSPKLKQGYQFSRELSGLFDSEVTPEVAKAKLADWIARVNDSELTCFNTFIKTLIKFEESICNYFINRYSSGFVEGFNNKVKVLKRRCYGLSDVTRLFQRLIIDNLGMERFHPAVAAF